jgi:ankyrin repeat protein
MQAHSTTDKTTALKKILNSGQMKPKNAMALITDGADATVQDNSGNTLLHLLVTQMHTEEAVKAIEELVAKDKDLFNVKNKDQKTPLQLLMYRSSSIKNAMILIGLGANPQDQDVYGNTLLHLLVKQMDTEEAVKTIKELVAKDKGLLNVKNNTQQTPLQLLMYRSPSIKNAMILIGLGANPQDQDDYGDTILHRAIIRNKKRNHDVAIQELLKIFKIDINVKNKNLQLTPLIKLISSKSYPGKLDFIKWLITQGADLNLGDKDQSTALHYAAFIGDLEVGQWLVTHKEFSITSKNQFGQTPLYYACRWGRLDFAKWLVSLGANPTEKINNHETLLHAAVLSNNLPMVKWLVQCANIDLSAINIDELLSTKEIKEYLITLVIHAKKKRKEEEAATATAFSTNTTLNQDPASNSNHLPPRGTESGSKPPSPPHSPKKNQRPATHPQLLPLLLKKLLLSFL